jgi:hypothetical protein
MAEMRTYFCKRQTQHLVFGAGEDPVTHKHRPPIEVNFHNHMLRTSDPKIQELVEGHDLYGPDKKMYRVDAENKPIVKGTQYTEGPATTASKPDINAKAGEVQLSAAERSALTRASKKVLAGGTLTATEQAVWDKHGDKG